MQPQRTRRFVCGLSVLMFLSTGTAQIAPGWYWNGRRLIPPARDALDKIVKAHELWISSNGSTGTRADLSHQNLSNFDLEGVNLCGADLEGSVLAGANLTKSIFGLDQQESERIARSEHLPPPPMNLVLTVRDGQGRIISQSQPVPGTTNLKTADISGAILVQTDLSFADLSKSDLSFANLSDADLSSANLSGANLSDAKLDGANMSNANVDHTLFEPASLSGINGLESATNLDLITFGTNPYALITIRNRFEAEGLDQQRREIVYAINEREVQLAPMLVRWLKFVAFDLTCKYGMNPERPLWLVSVTWMIFTLIYIVLLHKGCFRVSCIRSIRGKSKTREFSMRPHLLATILEQKKITAWLRLERRMLFAMMYFSMVNAFDLGFGEFPVGQWLRKLTMRQYEIKASGWARFFAGVQSIVSILLIALWVRLYVGHPFE